MTGRDPMKGRHSVGGRTGSAGKIRGGQGPSGSGVGTGLNQKTGVAANNTLRSQAPKPAILTDAKNLSLDAQKKIVRPPMPFADPQGYLNVKANSGPRGAKPGGESVANPKGVYAGKSGNTVTARALPGGAATGYSKLPNQSGQIGGRMGFPPPARKAGSQNLSSVKRNRSFYGQA